MKKTSTKNAFTLVESLVAISILLIATVGPLSIVASSIATANLAKDQVVAYYLAQEAIEMVRNIRETNAIVSPGEWLKGLYPTINNPDPACQNGCAIDAINSTLKTCATINDNNCRLYKVEDGSNGQIIQVYTHDPLAAGAVPTTFYRRIVITPVSITPTGTDDDEAEVKVEVKWKTGSLEGLGQIDRTFTIKERMYDW
jgi:prepilin-type N-terminal cleavage/methylation domain-containing protein